MRTKISFIILSIFLILCTNNDKKKQLSITYHHNGNLKSLSVIENNLFLNSMYFSEQEKLEYVASGCKLIVKNTNKTFDFHINFKYNNNVVMDSFTLSDTLHFKACSKNEIIPWMSECNEAFVRINYENEYYDKVILKAWNSYLEIIDSFDYFQKKFNLNKNDMPEFSNIDEMKNYLEPTVKSIYSDLLLKSECYTNRNSFLPLYLNLKFLNKDTSFNYLNKYKYNSCNDHCSDFECYQYIFFKLFYDYGTSAECMQQHLSFLELDNFTITNFITDENDCVHVSVIFHKTGIYNMNITNVLPFKGVDLYSEENNRPFMTFSTNDFMIKVLPED